MSFPIYLRAVFRSFGYLKYSDIIFFLSEEYCKHLGGELRDENFVYLWMCTLRSKQKKIPLGQFWDKIQDSCSWDLPLSCAEGQNLLSSLCLPCPVPKACRTCLLKEGEGGIWGCCNCQQMLSCWLCSVWRMGGWNQCPPFLPLLLLWLPGWPEASTARPVRTVHGLKTFYSGLDPFCSVQLCGNLCGPDVAWLSVLDFPVWCSLSVIIYWLHKEHLNFQHDKLCQNCCKWQWLYILLPEEVLGVLPAFISCMSCWHLSSFMCCLVYYFCCQWPNFQLDESA